MILDELPEIKIMAVLDRGVPNRECIALRVERSINMAQYGMLLGISLYTNGLATPIRDNFFWFGEGLMNVGDWVFIYTGSGENTFNPSSDNTHMNYTLYWNRPVTVLHNSNVVPMVFRMDAVQVHHTQSALPQN